jgi:hypothetical protein
MIIGTAAQLNYEAPIYWPTAIAGVMALTFVGISPCGSAAHRDEKNLQHTKSSFNAWRIYN